METVGLFAPESETATRETHEMLASAAESVVKELARDVTSDAAAYDELVSDDRIRTAQETLFASLLEVHVGTREEYEQWCNEGTYERIERGNENVSNVVWHAAPVADTVVAATFQNEREAAVGTLRRQAFGTVYREVLSA